MFYRRNFTL